MNPAKGVGRAPDADRLEAYERREVHVGRIHRDHHVAMAEEREFRREADVSFRHVDDISLPRGPFRKHGFLPFPGSEEEYARVRLGCQGVRYLPHHFRRVYLAGMLGKGGYGYPTLMRGFGAAACEKAASGPLPSPKTSGSRAGRICAPGGTCRHSVLP